MNFRSNDNPRFCVYVHTSPNGKRYVGITSQTPVERWGVAGKGYVDNKHFYSAIQKYGWDNFKHDIVATNLDLKAASDLECELISKYDTMNSEHGYNHTTGGNWSTPSDEVKEKLRIASKSRWQDPEYHQRMCLIQQTLPHKPLTSEHKQHISDSSRGKPHANKGRKLSEEHRAKMLGRPAWNKGLTKEDHPGLKHASEVLKSREFSDEMRCNMRVSRKALYASGYKPVWINNGELEKQIDVSKDSNLPEGFSIGRLPTVYVTKCEVTKKIYPKDLDAFIKDGWVRGKSAKITETIKRVRQQYVWLYDNREFISAEELASYLRDHGYPKIVGSTINTLYLTKCSKSGVYTDLVDKVDRKVIN